MIIRGSADYSTAITAFSNSDALARVVRAPEKNNSVASEQNNRRQSGQATPVAVIQTTGRTASLSPLLSEKNLDSQTKKALTTYIGVQNQLQSEINEHNRQLLGIDFFV